MNCLVNKISFGAEWQFHIIMPESANGGIFVLDKWLWTNESIIKIVVNWLIDSLKNHFSTRSISERDKLEEVDKKA